MGRGKCHLILRVIQRKRTKRRRERIERGCRLKAVEATTLRL
jgi:hypothetical protein